jgi:hypothetical protein
MHLVYLVYIVLKLLPVPVPARHNFFLKKIGFFQKKKSYSRECPLNVDTHV